MKRIILFQLLLLCVVMGQAQEVKSDTTTVGQAKEKKGGFFKALMKPINWIGKNWSAYDSTYCIPAKYNWVVQVQNTSSVEWLNMSSEDGMEIKMRSRMSHKIGPYLGYSFLMYGYTVDLNAWKGTNRKNEFTLSINSNLVNIDLIRRRTGGDFITRSLKGAVEDPTTGETNVNDMTAAAQEYELGDLMDYDITGINMNYFVNHKRYSNPAAFTNGAIQLRSAGSWILGWGYSHQKSSSDVSDAIVDYGLGMMNSRLSPEMSAALLDDANEYGGTNYKSLTEYATHLTCLYDEDIEKYKASIARLYNNTALQPYLFGEKVYAADGSYTLKNLGMLSVLLNDMPSVSTIDDWNIHIGYAYNYVISPKLLFGISFIAAPGIKRVRYDNHWSVTGATADELAKAMNTYFELDKLSEEQQFAASDFQVNESYTHFGTDFFGRASLTYTNDRWRTGLNINANAYYLRSKDLNVTNAYGSAVLYVGYCFGKPKKMYRQKKGQWRMDGLGY